jgi:acyl carrier protein
MTINLITIKKSLQPAVISSFWTMLRECETKVENDNDPVLKHWVEQWYNQWNVITGGEQSPSWIKAEKPSEKEERSVRERIRSVIIFQLGLDANLADSTTMLELGADSFDLVEVVIALEDEFSVELSDEIAERMTCVDNTVPFILRELKKRLK